MEEWVKIDNGEIEKHEKFVLFLYTPICGTCKVGERMLSIVEELLPNMQMKKVDLNYIPEIAERWEIQSVPCLLLFNKGEMSEKIYAFQSVEYLYNELKK